MEMARRSIVGNLPRHCNYASIPVRFVLLAKLQEEIGAHKLKGESPSPTGRSQGSAARLPWEGCSENASASGRRCQRLAGRCGRGSSLAGPAADAAAGSRVRSAAPAGALGSAMMALLHGRTARLRCEAG